MAELNYSPLLETQVAKRILSDSEIEQLAKQYGTPLYVIDEVTLRRKLNELKSAYNNFMGSVKIAYSMKANFNPGVLKVFISENILFDITSIGELYFYSRCGGRFENVIYTSVTEERDEYSEVLKKGVSTIVVSSYNGLSNLIEASSTLNVQPRVLIRVNPEVGVKAEVRASYRYGKFGVPFNTSSLDSAKCLLKKILSTPHLKFEGFHFHLGSQITDPTCYINALDKLENFILKMRKTYPDLSVNSIDIGGGTPVFYDEPVPTPYQIGSLVAERLNRMLSNLKCKFDLIVESGRYLSAEACVLISKVVNVKEYANQRYAFLDAGYHLLLDAALLRQPYPLDTIPKSFVKDDNVKVNVVGRLCDTYDVFVVPPSSNLSGIECGKLVVFYNVGAYSIVFNMPFHCQTKPAIVMKLMDGRYVLTRKAQTLEELFIEEGGGLDIQFTKNGSESIC
ncbi:MAG: hypothetical protein NZ896_04700 [Nitrososphaerales archaeon]|nr:hypothetical protein [Nitrososphaerales archaeon]